MLRILDRITDLTGSIAAWMFFAVGLFITWEVVLRYVFTAPTIWVDEVSRIFQIWATFLAAGYALKHRQLIVIDVFFKDPETLVRKLSETLSIVIIAVFAAVTVKYGFDLWLKALKAGHTTDTFLGPPKWLTHGSVWIGMALLFAQCIIELVRVWTKGVPVPTEHVEP